MRNNFESRILGFEFRSIVNLEFCVPGFVFQD